MTFLYIQYTSQKFNVQENEFTSGLNEGKENTYKQLVKYSSNNYSDEILV